MANSQFPLSCIIDVGVLTDTYELRINFPNVKHILIEPQIKYNDLIKENYKNNIFELMNIGCDEKEGILYLHSTNIYLNSNNMNEDQSLPSHNRLNNNYSDISIKVDTLNNISEKINNWILLKIDVDGKEIDILKGADLCLQKCAFVIIEATTNSFNEISNILHNSGFTLFNIVDICYLKNAFSQCDLIFINNNVKKLHDDFDPLNNIKCDENIFAKHYYQFNPI